MSRLVTKNNIAVFEYPETQEYPEFQIQPDGQLCIFGYYLKPIPVLKAISCMKMYPVDLKGYEVVGKYDGAEDKAQYRELIDSVNLDICNCVCLIRVKQYQNQHRQVSRHYSRS